MARDTPTMMGAERTQDVAAFILDRLRQWGVQQVFGYPVTVPNGMVSVFARRFGPRGLLGVLSAVLGRSRRAGHHAGISDW
jgi:hypothetical protein